MSTAGGGGWLTTKKRGRDDDQISRDRSMVLDRRIEEMRIRWRRRDEEEKKNNNVGRRLVACRTASSCTYTRRLMIDMKNDNNDDEEEDDDGAHNDEVKPPVAVPAKTVPNDSFDDDHLSSSLSGSDDDDDDELDLLSEEEDLLSSSSSGDDDDDDDDNMTDFEKMKLAFRLKMMKEPKKREGLIPPAKKATDKDDDDDDNMTDFEKMKLAFRLKMMKEPKKREDLIPPAKKATEKEKTKAKSHRQYNADIWEDSDDDDDDDDDNMTDFEKMKLTFRLKMMKEEPKKRRPSQKSRNLPAPIPSAFILPKLPPSDGINHGQRNPLFYKSLLEYASKASPPSDGINHGQRNPLFYKSRLEYASKESPLMVLFDVTNDLRPSILCYLSVQDLSTAQICCRALDDAITPHWSELDDAMLTLGKPHHRATGTTAKERVIKTTSAQTYAKRMDGAAARHYGFKIGPGMETRLGTYYGFPRRLMSFFYLAPKCIEYDFYIRLTRRNLPDSEYNAYFHDDEGGGEDTDDEIGDEEEEEGVVVVGEDDEEGNLGDNDGGSSGRDEGDEDDLWDDDTDSSHGNASAIGEPYQGDTNEDMIWEGFVKTVTYDMRQCALKFDMHDAYEQMDWKEMRDLTGLTRLSHPMYPTYRNRAIHNLRVIVVAIPRRTAWAKPSLVVATAGWDKDKQSIRGTHVNYFMTSTKALPHNEYSSRIVNTQVSVQLSAVDDNGGNEGGTFLGLIVK